MRLWSLVAVLALSGCAAEDRYGLLIDLQTDYLPGVEFDEVEVMLSGALMADNELYLRLDAETGDDYLSGHRIGEIVDLPEGAYRVVTKIRRRSGELVAEQVGRVPVRSVVGATFQIFRGCAGLTCPGDGDDAEATECRSGRCVPPSCTFAEADSDACAVVCASDDECPSLGECASAVCDGGVCFYAADDALCPGGTCDLEAGCQPLDCGDCDDGDPCTDDRCSAGVCESRPDPEACDDGIACTIDTCSGVGCDRVFDDTTCDDGNPCTVDTCTAAGCVSSPEMAGAPCDDGVFCNGADTCIGGTCTPAGASPCAGGMMCNESLRTCGCASDADCPPPSNSWEACGGFAGPCDESGVRDGERSTWSCNVAMGVCQETITALMNRPCSRATDGRACDDGDLCNGTETCSGGTCTVPGTPLSEGAVCGRSTRDRCCGGTCVDVQTNAANCGACGVACPTGSCRRTRVGSPAQYTGVCRSCTVGGSVGCPSAGWTCRDVGGVAMCHCNGDNSLCAPFGWCLDTAGFHACTPTF